MMRKKIKTASVIMVLILLIGGFVFAGGDAEKKGGEVTYLTFGTGGTGGTWYPVGGILAAAMSKADSVEVSAQTSAASLENIRLVGSGERQLGFASSGLLKFAVDGVEMFAGEEYPNMASIASLLPNQFQFVVRADSGINGLSDLAGKSVGTGAPGSGDKVIAEAILDALGIGDSVKEMPLSFSEQVTAFKNRQIDCIFVAAASPTAAILDAASQAKVKLLGFTDAEKVKVTNAMNYAVESVIPAETYTFLDEDMETFATLTTLFTSTTIPENIIYDAVKAMWAELETIKSSHAAMKDWNMDLGTSGFPVPAHPGAAKFYKEMGKM